MGDACRALNTPVTGGNVSFYNESAASAIWPTPIVGMLGLLDDYRLAVRSGWVTKQELSQCGGWAREASFVLRNGAR